MYRSTLFALFLFACGPQTSAGVDGGGGMPDALSIDAPNITICGGHTVDTNTDSAHCGGCDQACPSGLSCVMGSCSNDPNFYIGGLSTGSPDHATLAGQVWVILDVGGMHAAGPGSPDTPTVTFGDTMTADGAVAPSALGDWRNGAARMYAQGGPNADLAHVTAIAPPHGAGTVPITLAQGTRRAIRLNAFHYDRAILPMMWTTRGKLSPGQGDPDGQLLGFLVGRADRPATSIVPDGHVVVGGGNCAANSWCAGWSMVEVYEPVTGVSRVAGNLAVGRAWIESITLVDGRVLMAGGVHSTTNCGAPPTFDAPTHTETCPYMGNMNASGTNLIAAVNADLYVPQVGGVVAAGNMNHARSGQTLTLLNDGRVLVVGGSELNHWGNPPAGPSVEVFDPVSNTFSAPATSLPGLVDHAAGRTREGAVIVAGGRSVATHPNPSPASFKVIVAPDGTLAVTPTPSLPKPVMDHDPANQLTLAPSGDLVMVPGAADDGTGPFFVFRAATQTWDSQTAMLPLKYWPGAALVGDGTIVACGGSDAMCGGTTSCMHIDSATFAATSFNALATLVRESPMVVLPSGGAMMTGGTSGANPTDCGGDAANNTLSVLLP